MKLTDKAVMAARPKERVYRVFDGEGLYLEVHPTGAKYWRMKCRVNDREDRLAFGVYPKVSLAEAREKRRKAHDTLAAGKNPRDIAAHAGTTFRNVATAWFDARKGGWSEAYAATVWHRLEYDVFRRLGDKEIGRIDAQDVLSVIRPIDGRGAPVKAKRVLRYINGIFAYAIITIGEMQYSPGLGLHAAISTRPVKHNSYLKEGELPEFLKRLDAFRGSPIVLLATKFLMLTMTRTSETRFARPEEVDWKAGVWKIPAERMKMGRTHLVPLSRQAIEVLKEALEHGGDYVFPSPMRRGRPISYNTILYALYDLGYRGKLTGHGFRATASTILNERGYNTLAIERQLAHVDRNTVRASYNHAELLNERREILQAWADILDGLRSS